MKATTKKDRPTLTREQIALFDKVRMQIKQLAEDMENLSRKTPDGPLSKFKLGFINEQLRKANTLLKSPFQAIEGFEEFDVDNLPSNSDVVMVLAQYITCLEVWRSAHVHLKTSGDWVWNVPDEDISAAAATNSLRDQDRYGDR